MVNLLIGASRAGRRAALALPAIVTCVFFLTNAGSALAFFSTGGSGSGSIQAATILGPSGVTVTQSGTNVTVGWDAATLSGGSAVQGYQVTRSDGTIICGAPAFVTSLGCVDAGVSSGTYTYAVKAVYRSWDAIATSASFTILTAPTISAEPVALSNSTSASFSFSGGNGGAYQCRLDGGAYAGCVSPGSYSGLSQGSHAFTVRAVSGSSNGPGTSYAWSVDSVPPSQAVALASGTNGAFMSATTLYYRGAVAGSLRLTDAVSDSGSGPASASYPSIATTGWTHAGESVTAPSGGPYSSSTFSWSANPSLPVSYSVTGADAAGNTTSTSLTFVNDSTAPTGGQLTVNGAAATASGSTSQAVNSTSFAIGSRSDYADSISGLSSSILTLQSESLAGSACGTPGSGGPFTSLTTISGTTQPAGIVAGYCYVYTLTGTDNVGNVAHVSSTVIDNALSFRVTTQPVAVTAGVATAANAVVLTAMKNGATDVTYAGSPLTWLGASDSPSGAAPTLPTGPTWIAGQATFGITLTKAEIETLTVGDGTRGATLAAITVSTGPASNVAWTDPSNPAGLPSPCLFTCTYASGFGNGQTWSANVSITDSQGNVIANIGPGVSVLVSLGGTGKGSTSPASPATIAIPASGPATSSVQLQYTSPAHGNYLDAVMAASGAYTSATASFSR